MCISVFLLIYFYGLNTELIEGSSNLEFHTFKIIRQFFVRLFVRRRDAKTTRRNICNYRLLYFGMRNVFYRFQRPSSYYQKQQVFYNETARSFLQSKKKLVK